MSKRGKRFQIMLTSEELILIENFRFKYRMPNRASAVRELLNRGLSTDGFSAPEHHAHSRQFRVTERKNSERSE